MMRQNIDIKILGFLISLAFFPGFLSAEQDERWYNVEVIIFAYSSDFGLQQEHWPVETGKPDVSGTVTLIETDALELLPGQIIEYEALPLAMLLNALDRLQQSSRYDVIYANAWRLPGLPRRYASPVRIAAGKRFITTDDSVTVVSADQEKTEDGITGDARYEIDGRIKISLSRFLDVDADLLYQRLIKSSDANGTPVNELRQFRLTEFRRMKNDTVHYLDHPLFGVIIGIQRQQDEDNEQPDNTNLKPAREVNL